MLSKLTKGFIIDKRALTGGARIQTLRWLYDQHVTYRQANVDLCPHPYSHAPL